MKTKVKITCDLKDGTRLKAQKAPKKGLCTGCYIHQTNLIFNGPDCMSIRPSWAKELPLFCDKLNIVWVKRRKQ
jgi:hypothetical protein